MSIRYIAPNLYAIRVRIVDFNTLKMGITPRGFIKNIVLLLKHINLY